MKLKDIETKVGTLLTTKESRWSGGDTILILATGWEAAGRGSLHGRTRFRKCTQYSTSRNGVAVAVKRAWGWEPDVIPAQQIVDVTPEELDAIKAKREADRNKRHQEWRDNLVKTADLVERARNLGIDAWEGNGARSIVVGLEDFQAILEILEGQK